mmetsp:Transcript_3646/g.10762  ORF Transcript_3646/g.10762 Transcript_3646/m.10762 type:complete len:112 (+) Transcript_3646:139-474(+)
MFISIYVYIHTSRHRAPIIIVIMSSHATLSCNYSYNFIIDVIYVCICISRWVRAIPQYNIGYHDIRAEVDRALEGLPGLFLGGNYMSGVAFGDCVQWGVEAAPRVQAALRA